MKTNKNTITQPELFVDDDHGIYMGQIAWKYLSERCKKQARKKLSEEDIKILEAGPDDEFYHEVVELFTEIDFTTESGQKVNIEFAEGGMWVIPACFRRSKKAKELFGE